MVQVRELTAKLGLTGDAAGGLAKFGLAVGGVKEALGLVVGAFGAAKSVLFDFTADIAKAGDEIAKAAKRTGISAESFQELKFAAEVAGASMTDVEKGIQRLSKNLNDARVKGTGPFIDQLDALGIGIEEFDGLEPDQAFERVAEILETIPDKGDQAAFAIDALGKGGARLVPLLGEGADAIRELREEAGELGILSNEDALASEEFADAQLRLEQSIQGVKFAIGAELIPFVREIIDEIRIWVQENKDLVSVDIAAFIRELLTEAKQLGPTFKAGALALANLLKFTVEVVKEGQTLAMLLTQWNDDTGVLTESWNLLVEAVKLSIKPFTLTADAIERTARAVGLLDDEADPGRTQTRGVSGSGFSKSQLERANRLRVSKAATAATRAVTNSLIISAGEAATAASSAALGASTRKRRARRQVKARRQRSGAGGKSSGSQKTTDEDLLRLISSVPGADIEGADQRLLPGAPPVIAVQVTRNDFKINAPQTNNIEAPPGTTVEEIRETIVGDFRDQWDKILIETAEILQPATAR